MNTERLEMRFWNTNLLDVEVLGRYHYVRAKEVLESHSHAQCLEICCLAKGQQRYIVNEQTYRMSPGDVFITFPGEVHSSGPYPEEKSILYWLIIKIPKAGGSFLNQPLHEGNALKKALLGLDQRMFHGIQPGLQYLDGILTLRHERASPLRNIHIQNQLVAFLLEVIQCARKNAHPSRSVRMENLLRYIDQHMDSPLGLSDLSEQTQLSVSRFKAWFKKETGLPPGEYILRRKMKKAQRLLSNSDLSITHIAFDLGFSSSQYFATVFKRYTGQTPRAHRNAPVGKSYK